jgi:hypothetical protein
MSLVAQAGDGVVMGGTVQSFRAASPTEPFVKIEQQRLRAGGSMATKRPRS